MQIINLKEACEVSGTSKQNLYVAIKKGRIKAWKKEGSNRLELHRDDLERYLKNKFKRSDSRFEGKLRWDKKKGEFSVGQAAEFLGVPANMLYYFLRTGQMAYTKKGCSYVLDLDELLRVKTNLIDK